MAESTASLDFSDFKKEVAGYLRISRTESDWSTKHAALVADYVHSGIRKVYAAHDWSFLSPVTTQVTEADDKDYDLSDDFAYLMGPLSFGAGEGSYSPLTIVSDAVIRDMWQRNDTTARPKYAAVRPATSDGTDGQRFELILYPIPDAEYTLYFRQRIHPIKLTDAAPYPLGGSMHSETFLESCLAVAEQRADDESRLHRDAYDRCLQESIQLDKRITAPDFIGGGARFFDRAGTDRDLITYEDTLYEL